MNIQRWLCTSAVVACCMIAVAHAQQAPGQSQKPRSDNQANQPYLLGPGDIVEIKIFGSQDLNTTAQVDGDGNLSSLAFLDPIPAKCRSEKQVQKDITAAYARLVKEPQVSVRVVERNSRTPASIFGAVRQSTRVPMQRKQRLNELIAAAGGFSEKTAGTIQIVHTEPVMCPGPGEEEQGLPVDGTAIPFNVVRIAELQKGLSNPIIRPGDLVLVTEAEPIYIMGSVVAPGSILMRDQLTLSRALAMVGGARKEAKLSEIRIYRQKTGATGQEIIKVNYAAIKKNEIPDVFLQPYDAIDVSDTGIFQGTDWWAKVLEALTGGLRNRMLIPM